MEKDNNTAKQFQDQVKDAAKFLNFAPVLTISALTGIRVQKIFDRVNTVHGQFATRINTGLLNRIVEKATQRNEPSMFRGRRLKFYYVTQITSKPPTFVCFVNYPQAVHFSYKRYLMNQIRMGTGLDQTPIRLFFRQRTGRLSKGK